MNSTSGAWQVATGVSRELRVEPGGSTVLYVWLSFSFLLLVVFLILALSFARHTKRVLRRRRVLLDYAEANITILRPRIHRMFTSRVGSMVTAWPDLTACSRVEADSLSDSIADDHRGSTIDQWPGSQGSRCSSPRFARGSVDRVWSDGSRIFWTDWSHCTAYNSDKHETQFGLQTEVTPFSPGVDAGRRRMGDPGLGERHRATRLTTRSHVAFCVHKDLSEGDVMRVLSPSAPLLQELSSISLSSTSDVEDWSRDCSLAATRPLGSTTIAWSPSNTAGSSFTANVTPIRPFGKSYVHLERHPSSDADPVFTQRESSLPFYPPFSNIHTDIHTDIHTASRRPLRRVLSYADASKTADVGRFESAENNERLEGSTSSEARSCHPNVCDVSRKQSQDVSDVYSTHYASDVSRTHHQYVNDVYSTYHHDDSDVCSTDHHVESDVYSTHHHHASDISRTHRQDVSDVNSTHDYYVSDVYSTHHHDESDVSRTHNHYVGDVFRTRSGGVDVSLTSSASKCVKTARRSRRWSAVRHDGDCGQTRAAGCDQSPVLGLSRKQHTTDFRGRRSGTTDDEHSAIRPAEDSGNSRFAEEIARPRSSESLPSILRSQSTSSSSPPALGSVSRRTSLVREAALQSRDDVSIFWLPDIASDIQQTFL